MPQHNWFEDHGPTGGASFVPPDGMATPQAGYHTQAPSAPAGGDGAVATAYSPAQQQVLDAYRRAGHTPPDPAALAEWANGIMTGRASLGELEATLSRAMQQPGAQRYDYGAPSGGGWDWNRWDELTQQYPGTVAGLDQLVREHPELGVKIVGGSRGDIQLPGGQIWDVMLSAGEGGKGWTRIQDTGAAGSYGELLQPWTREFAHAAFEPPPRFKAPTGAEVFEDPSFQFRMSEGLKALERSKAAKGTLRTGGTLKELAQFSQDYASQEYGNVYNRRLGEHQLQYGQTASEFDRDYANALGEYGQAYNIFEGNQAKQFNRLASIAGYGQTAANQLGSLGAGYAGAYGANVLGTAGRVGDFYTQAANARAAGQVGGANAWANAFGQIGNNAMNAYWMQGFMPPRPPPQTGSGYVPQWNQPGGWTGPTTYGPGGWG